MRELNTIELNEVNGALSFALPGCVSAHPYVFGSIAATLAVAGLGAAVYYGYKQYYGDAPSVSDFAQAAVATFQSK